MSAVDDIRAAINTWDAYWATTYNDPVEMLNAEVPDDVVVLFTTQSADYVRYLLARLDALERVASVARVLCAHEDMLQDAIEYLANTWSENRRQEAEIMANEYAGLQEALAALDADGGEREGDAKHNR